MGILSRSAQLLSCAVIAIVGALGAYRAHGGALDPAARLPTREVEAYAAVRQTFRDAYARALDGETTSAADSVSLEAYPLYAYLIAARIRGALLGPPETLATADASARHF